MPTTFGGEPFKQSYLCRIKW
ncbi:hypothetical protein [Staphylococcus aureus]